MAISMPHLLAYLRTMAAHVIPTVYFLYLEANMMRRACVRGAWVHYFTKRHRRVSSGSEIELHSDIQVRSHRGLWAALCLLCAYLLIKNLPANTLWWLV